MPSARATAVPTPVPELAAAHTCGRATCSTLKVPVDRSRAAGETLELKVAVERAGVALRVLGAGVALVASRAAATLAAPAHDVPVAREAIAVTQQATAQHRDRAYATRARR